MASKNIVFRGKSYWARPYEGMEDEFDGVKNYKISVALDDESWGKLAKSGLKLKKRDLADGAQGVTFKRNVEGKEFADKKTGKIKTLGGGPIPVYDADDNEIDDLVGNESDVEVLVNVYTGEYKGRKFVGHRTEGIRVLKLVKYDRFVEDDDDVSTSDDNGDSDVSSASGFSDLDEPPVKKKVKTVNKKKLPF